MKWRIFGLALFLWLLSTSSVLASVRLNEIAWMGTTLSPTNEWIELYNDTALPVVLSDWKIEARDGLPSVALSGILPPNGYFLIERTDDNSVPGVKADLIISFGTGLSNSGETLLLTDASSTIIDTVMGGASWTSIGGNNETKETAQRTLGGWVTGAPTPGRENIKFSEKILSPSVSTGEPVVRKVPASKASSGKTAVRVAPEPGVSATGTGTTVLWERDSSHSTTRNSFEAFLSKNTLYLWALLLILLFAFAGFIIIRSQKEKGDTAEDYTLIEDIIETADDEA